MDGIISPRDERGSVLGWELIMFPLLRYRFCHASCFLWYQVFYSTYAHNLQTLRQQTGFLCTWLECTACLAAADQFGFINNMLYPNRDI